MAYFFTSTTENDEGYFFTNNSPTLVVYPSHKKSRWRTRTPGYPRVPLFPTEYHLNEWSYVAGTMNKSSSYIAAVGPPPVSVSYERYGLWQTDIQSGYWDSGRPSVDLTRYINVASNNALQRIKDKTVDVGQSVGEIHQTIGMISSRIIKIANAARHLKHGLVSQAVKDLTGSPLVPHTKTLSHIANKSRSMKRTGKSSGTFKLGSKDFADGWLELQFGWKPLVNDIVGYAVTIDDRLSRRPAYCYATGRSNGDAYSLAKDVFSEDVSVPGATFSQFLNVSNQVELWASVEYCYAITNPAVSALQRIGLSNAPALAYDFVPFSFVLDWFVNVGQCIDLMDTWYGKQFIWGRKSYGFKQRSLIHSGKSSYQKTVASSSARVVCGVQERNYVESHREILTAPNAPRLVFDIPTSGWHAATAISLLQQLFKGK